MRKLWRHIKWWLDYSSYVLRDPGDDVDDLWAEYLIHERQTLRSKSNGNDTRRDGGRLRQTS